MNLVTFSDYLQGRSFNRTILNNIGKQLTPFIEAFNSCHPRQVTVQWDMSAKYQTGTIMVEMADGDDLSPEAREWIECSLSDQLNEQFGYDFDEDDIRSSYASLPVGF
jgi:hypothetical protein